MYNNIKVNISDGQKQKLRKALENGEPVSIRLDYEDTCGGEDQIALTDTQVDKLVNANNNGRGVTIKMSKKQLRHNLNVEGGFLGMLAGLAAKALPFLAKNILPGLATGALSGLANAGVKKALGNGMYLKKGGKVCQVETFGNSLYLKPYQGSGLKKLGDGFYVKQGGQIFDGSGLLLGPDSPLKNVPILGWIF